MMRRICTFGLALALAACAAGDDDTAALESGLQSGGVGRYLVVFKSETLPADAAARVTKAGGQVVKSIPEIGVLAAAGNATFAAKLARDTSVQAVGVEELYAAPQEHSEAVTEAVDADDATPDGAPTAADAFYFRRQWDMRRIGAPAAWTRPLPTRPTVAVLDSGVMDDHPDLAGQVVRSVATSYCPSSGGGNNSAGYPVYRSLIDFVAHPSWEPSMGCAATAAVYDIHGTHVSGTIAARFGGGAVVGVAPEAQIAAYKVFDRYRTLDADGKPTEALGAFTAATHAAIVDAAAHHYPLVTMSLGSAIVRNDKDGNASWLAWNRVASFATRQGTLIIASAGNESLNVNGVIAHVPGDIPSIINTSATGWSLLTGTGSATSPVDFAPGSHDVFASYSNYGSTVDLTGPGGDCGPDPAVCDGRYLIISDGITATGAAAYFLAAGTSMATPHITGVAARVVGLHPDWSPAQIRAQLDQTAQDLGDRQLFGHGMVDADAATR